MNRGNRRINVRAVELLQPRRDERVLDLGFGGGLGLDLLLDRTDHVVGVDRAGDMVAAARAARADAVASGRLTLLEGDVSAPPLADDSVDGIVTVNTVYFWPDLPTAFSECVACSPRTAAW
jgi:arsenite methyltransferase